jgi:hypothetical protein
MDTQRSVGEMSNDEVLALFGTTLGSADRGFDEATHARVWAYEFVRSRARLAHYRILYTAFIENGMRYMIENLDELNAEKGVPAKLVFTNEFADVLGLEDSAEVIVWTERTLLDELARERAILDYLASVLDEFQVAVPK